MPNSLNNEYNNKNFAGSTLKKQGDPLGLFGSNSSFNINNSYGDLNIEDVDLSQIASNANDALAGDYIAEDKIHNQYFEEGELTYQIRDDGSVLISKDGVPMGFTTVEALNASKVQNNYSVASNASDPTLPNYLDNNQETSKETSNTVKAYREGFNKVDNIHTVQANRADFNKFENGQQVKAYREGFNKIDNIAAVNAYREGFDKINNATSNKRTMQKDDNGYNETGYDVQDDLNGEININSIDISQLCDKYHTVLNNPQDYVSENQKVKYELFDNETLKLTDSENHVFYIPISAVSDVKMNKIKEYISSKEAADTTLNNTSNNINEYSNGQIKLKSSKELHGIHRTTTQLTNYYENGNKRFEIKQEALNYYDENGNNLFKVNAKNAKNELKILDDNGNYVSIVPGFQQIGEQQIGEITYHSSPNNNVITLYHKDKPIVKYIANTGEYTVLDVDGKTELASMDAITSNYETVKNLLNPTSL